MGLEREHANEEDTIGSFADRVVWGFVQYTSVQTDTSEDRIAKRLRSTAVRERVNQSGPK